MCSHSFVRLYNSVQDSVKCNVILLAINFNRVKYSGLELTLLNLDLFEVLGLPRCFD